MREIAFLGQECGWKGENVEVKGSKLVGLESEAKTSREGVDGTLTTNGWLFILLEVIIDKAKYK